MIQALIVAHGDLARALLESFESMAGPQKGVRALSNVGCGLPDIVDRITSAASELGPGPIVIFTDLLGGSCSHAAQQVVRGRPDWHVVTGVNLPMLVNFFQNRESQSVAETLALMLARARDGMQSISGC